MVLFWRCKQRIPRQTFCVCASRTTREIIQVLKMMCPVVLLTVLPNAVRSLPLLSEVSVEHFLGFKRVWKTSGEQRRSCCYWQTAVRAGAQLVLNTTPGAMHEEIELRLTHQSNPCNSYPLLKRIIAQSASRCELLIASACFVAKWGAWVLSVTFFFSANLWNGQSLKLKVGDRRCWGKEGWHCDSSLVSWSM